MRLTIPQDELIRAIQTHGARAREARQVSSRLCDLLARRLADVRARLRRESPSLTPAEATRGALVDDEYTRFVDELVEVTCASRRERVEYDTHYMLFEARRSLRGMRR